MTRDIEDSPLVAHARPRSAIVWRYLPRGSVKHALTHSGSHVGHDPTALCGACVAWVEHWRGTGTQSGYEKVAQLPECRRCARLLTKDESHA